jgi:penicillin-binding protein 1C
MRFRVSFRLIAVGGSSILAFAALGWGAFEALDHAFPPPLPEKLAISTEVVDRDGALLRAFATPDGRWRLTVNLDQVDPQFVEMLIAYEDKRFHEHSGVDPLALLRAAGQLRG